MSNGVNLACHKSYSATSVHYTQKHYKPVDVKRRLDGIDVGPNDVHNKHLMSVRMLTGNVRKPSKTMLARLITEQADRLEKLENAPPRDDSAQYTAIVQNSIIPLSNAKQFIKPNETPKHTRMPDKYGKLRWVTWERDGIALPSLERLAHDFCYQKSLDAVALGTDEITLYLTECQTVVRAARKAYEERVTYDARLADYESEIRAVKRIIRELTETITA